MLGPTLSQNVKSSSIADSASFCSSRQRPPRQNPCVSVDCCLGRVNLSQTHKTTKPLIMSDLGVQGEKNGRRRPYLWAKEVTVAAITCRVFTLKEGAEAATASRRLAVCKHASPTSTVHLILTVHVLTTTSKAILVTTSDMSSMHSCWCHKHCHTAAQHRQQHQS